MFGKKLKNYKTQELCEELYSRMHAMMIKEEVKDQEVILFIDCFQATSGLIPIAIAGSQNVISILNASLNHTESKGFLDAKHTIEKTIELLEKELDAAAKMLQS